MVNWEDDQSWVCILARMPTPQTWIAVIAVDRTHARHKGTVL